MKRSFATYIEEEIFYKFLEKYRAPEGGSLTKRFAKAIENALQEAVEDTNEAPHSIREEAKEIGALEELRSIYNYRRFRGLSEAESFEEFLYEIVEYLKSDPLFETN